MEHLRSIALTVDENEPGQFIWLLLESQGDAIVFDVELECADLPFPSYIAALQAGYERLVMLSNGNERGPREAGQDEDADPVDQDQFGGNS